MFPSPPALPGRCGHLPTGVSLLYANATCCITLRCSLAKPSTDPLPRDPVRPRWVSRIGVHGAAWHRRPSASSSCGPGGNCAVSAPSTLWPSSCGHPPVGRVRGLDRLACPGEPADVGVRPPPGRLHRPARHGEPRPAASRRSRHGPARTPRCPAQAAEHPPSRPCLRAHHSSHESIRARTPPPAGGVHGLLTIHCRSTPHLCRYPGRRAVDGPAQQVRPVARSATRWLERSGRSVTRPAQSVW